MKCLELAPERCHLETFSTVTHFTHCNLCTGTLLYIAGQEDSVQTNLTNVLRFLVRLFRPLASSLARASVTKSPTGPNTGEYDFKN